MMPGRLASLLGVLVVACWSQLAGAEDEGTLEQADEGIIRFTFAPDPVWDYLKDSGIREQMEEESGIRILEQSTWDEFGSYASGNADVVSIGSFEVPLLQAETGRPATIFGKYNIDRSILVVPADSTAQTIEDLKGGKIAVWDALSSTVIWGVLANELHGLDFRTIGEDFEFVVTDVDNTGRLAANHDVDGALVLPDFNVPVLLNQEVRVLYDGRTAADLYGEVIGNPGHEGLMLNIFMAPTDWYDSHPDEVEFFLSLWQRGIAEWHANQKSIIESYPQHFAVETPEEIQFMKDYLSAHDWFVTSVYLDDEWVEEELKIFQMLFDAALAESANPPRFAR